MRSRYTFTGTDECNYAGAYLYDVQHIKLVYEDCAYVYNRAKPRGHYATLHQRLHVVAEALHC
jgi:hypothetical protein